MNILIVYSSVTGNTKYLAESLASSEHTLTVLPIYPVPQKLDYDIIFLGFWVYRGAPDPRMLRFMQKIQGKNIALFGTLSAYPHSEHAQKVLARAEKYLTGNTLLGSFLCLGKLEKKRYLNKLSASSAKHPMTKERQERLLEGQKHPTLQDCQNFQKFFDNVVKLQSNKIK